MYGLATAQETQKYIFLKPRYQIQKSFGLDLEKFGQNMPLPKVFLAKFLYQIESFSDTPWNNYRIISGDAISKIEIFSYSKRSGFSYPAFWRFCDFAGFYQTQKFQMKYGTIGGAAAGLFVIYSAILLQF